jgi:cytoskeletal protein CcmA (bactofilin family)
MFNKETENNKNHGAETIIGPSIKVKGDFHGEGDIIIEGSVEGEISTKQHIAVGKSAIILANIKANSAKIAGAIAGNIVVSGYLEVLSTAKINGNISAKELSIEKGAFIEGDLKMSSHKNPVQEK